MTDQEKIKAQVQDRFGAFAQGYVDSQTHAKGADLDRFVEWTQPQRGWLALDIATGGGHTALKLAPHVHTMIASDLTHNMLRKAQENIIEKEGNNVHFAGVDAEHLPFVSNVFDLVTCRIASHHFPSIRRFFQESTRILKSGGILFVQDHVLPNKKKAARYVDAFERLRDPSHVRAFAGYEWRGMFEDVGLEVEKSEYIVKEHDLIPWAERQGCTAETIEKLQLLLIQAPEKVREWMNPENAGTHHAAFCNRHILILGRKP